eukprot:TRINITY_DN20951_c0_g2_i4.p1 TRINITY_DN20951_c0_g2~~TRINITY_DN20951_c0_g2_i4.p1  ORF type:complete len:106 (-),score=27.12 TRINITY_DN20951_c0_g2_i4:176-493(-)
MVGIKVLPEGFLRGCTSLTAVTLPPNVTAVHNDFCHGCSSLVKIDLSPLKDIEVLNRGFLAGCTGLLEVDLSPLVSVVEVYGCSYTDVPLDLSDLPNTTSVMLCS